MRSIHEDACNLSDYEGVVRVFVNWTTYSVETAQLRLSTDKITGGVHTNIRYNNTFYLLFANRQLIGEKRAQLGCNLTRNTVGPSHVRSIT